MAVYVLDALRTPVANASAETGFYRDLRADSLAGRVIRALADRLAQRVPDSVPGEIAWGVSRQEGEQGYNLARQAGLEGGLSIRVPALTICRNCASGLDAILVARAMIECGVHQVMIAGGVEHMGHVPMRDHEPGPVFLDRFGPNALKMLHCAEHLARQFGLSRRNQDEWAHQSHQRAKAAQDQGDFAAEILPVATPGGGTVFRDQTIRDNSNLERLGVLRPLAGDVGTVTAGNASPVNVAAAGVLLAGRDWIRRHNLRPLARLVDGVAVGVEPLDMGLGPVGAIQSLLASNRVALGELDHLEVNEAFATQTLAVIEKLGADPAKVNPLGGAIALGHPLGATGARLVVTLSHALARKPGKGVVSLCVGGGQGVAALLESVS